ncbi:hypothetical protein THAOC_30887 [Thalassiosira oceanica]|uniref:Uncharacterized protein n=1 Tax=Thalassiosira oceanica TaxID=159749 RepID=K0R9D6_THAOC|nr:hypothetical protein THAOC_30887 [Thalassiosira oceanica]|eukprot:EJK50168.1 hypothetical protein THAOC_30887 [Thalassiosira oceanica]
MSKRYRLSIHGNSGGVDADALVLSTIFPGLLQRRAVLLFARATDVDFRTVQNPTAEISMYSPSAGETLTGKNGLVLEVVSGGYMSWMRTRSSFRGQNSTSPWAW